MGIFIFTAMAYERIYTRIITIIIKNFLLNLVKLIITGVFLLRSYSVFEFII